MKKCYFLILLLALICFVLPASGEEVGYTIDVADEITVGLNEYVFIPFERVFDGPRFSAVCSDPDALFESYEIIRDNNWTVCSGDLRIRMQKKGVYTLHFLLGTEEIRTTTVTVGDMISSASASQERYVLRVGETVDLHLTLGEGVMYGPLTFQQSSYDQNLLSISEDGSSMTALAPGWVDVAIKNASYTEIGSFSVLVLEESKNIELVCSECPDGIASVGSIVTLKPLSNGQSVAALVEITEGQEYVSFSGYGKTWQFEGVRPGLVKFTAHGTDGSVSTVQIRIFAEPEDFEIQIQKTTLTAGESVPFSVVFPENTWAKVLYTYPVEKPAERNLNGSVAVVSDGQLTAVTAGTCRVAVSAAGVTKTVDITVTDSPKALTVVRPNPYMDVESSFQLSVQDKLGNVYPATFSQDGQKFTIGENGLITPKHAVSGTLRATLENGAEFSFEVKAARFPKELTCSVEELSIALNDQYRGLNINDSSWYVIYDDLGAVSSHDIVVCSDDPSIITTELNGIRLHPQSVGRTTLTVWSRFCDVSVRVPIRVTEPMDILYVDGKDYAVMEVPVGATMKLPTVTDYYGNPVKVTWKMDEATSTSAFRLVNKGTSVKVLTDSGSTYVTATSQTGATLRCTVQAYKRSENFTLSRENMQLNTGSRGQIEIRKKVWTETEQGDGSMLYPDDLTYSLSGDVDCIQLESFGPGGFTFVGMKPGTVTMTVTLYNGFSASSVIQVLVPTACQNGHDPVWAVTKEAGAFSKGMETLQCSRCHLPLGQTRETPATGVISFCDQDVWLQPGQEIDLMTQLDGDRHYSFTWESSDPTVARVVADHLTVYDYGEATITASLYDCNPGTCHVHVIDPNADMIAYGDWLNLHWTLDKEGLLTISGTGAMDDFELHNDRAAWHLYSSQIKRVVIEAGVTSIGANAFEFCGKFTEISIPDTVTVIGNYAMNACSSLTEIHVPASVTAIGEGAFMDNWYLEAIHVDADNPVYRSIGGVLFSKDQRLLIQYPSANPRTVYEIPAGVEVIGERAFHHSSNLTEITISSGVTKIGRDAFTACENLASVTIPEGVTEIGSSAFAICQNLTSAAIPEGVSTLEMSLFDGCWKLASVSIPASVTKIGKYAFSLCYGLKDVYYHGTEDDWAGIEVEYGNDDLLKANFHCVPALVPQLILPASLTTIESEAFQGLPEGIVVFIPNAVTSIAEDAFDTGTVIVTPSGSFAAQWGREHGFEVHEQ